jgi:hypothetical protein
MPATQADPVDLGGQSDLIGALEPMSIEAVLAAPIAGTRVSCGWCVDLTQSRSVIVVRAGLDREHCLPDR